MCMREAETASLCAGATETSRGSAQIILWLKWALPQHQQGGTSFDLSPVSFSITQCSRTAEKPGKKPEP